MTLCYITSITSYVIQPIIDYPELMPTLTNILAIEQNSEVRQETIRLMGILGALDPYVLPNSRTSLESAVGEPKPIESEVPDISQILIGLNPSS
jgi:FKBP12-rapamycin complex-associated protein